MLSLKALELSDEDGVDRDKSSDLMKGFGKVLNGGDEIGSEFSSLGCYLS